MTTKPARPWRMLAPLITVVLLFVLWSGYWFFAQSAARAYAEGYRQVLAAQGVRLTCESEDWGGYPFRFEFSCSKPAVELPEVQMARAEDLMIVAQAYNPRHLIILVDGPSRIRLTSGETLDLTHDRAIASFVLATHGQLQVAAEFPNVAAGPLFTAKDIQVHTRPGEHGAIDAAVTLADARYLAPGKPPLIIERAQILALITTSRTVEIRQAIAQQGPLQLSAKGTIGLDDMHRLAGSIAVETNDLNGLMTVLDPHIRLTDQQRLAIKTLLGLLGKEARSSLIAKNGEFFLGPVKIGNLVPLY